MYTSKALNIELVKVIRMIYVATNDLYHAYTFKSVVFPVEPFMCAYSIQTIYRTIMT